MTRAVSRRRVLSRPARIVAVFIAVLAVAIGTIAPVAGTPAQAAAPAASSVRTASGPAANGLVQTYLDGFDPGNLISDEVFTNSGSMSEAQIQAFLNEKVPRCLGGSDQYGPIVCLKDYRTTSVTMPADSYCSGYSGAAGESAARIIYKAAVSCGINPQVLIVMLQKEQGLVTHTWPSAWRYDSALGQGCPDTAPCDPSFVGFFHQIYGAARQMQIYMEGRWFTWYAPGKTWNILYNPNHACGSAPVYISNKATSAMYYYTPYQPNAAALRAGFGVGDACSAYGNRNFYNYFTDWFGPTHGGPTQLPAPVIASADTSEYVVGTDASGTAWAYPFAEGRWGDPVRMASGLSGVRAFFGAGDVDGDGHRDFIADRPGQAPLMLRGIGEIGLTDGITLGGDWSGVTRMQPAGDFDGDGIPDLFTLNAGGGLFLRSGDGRGGFRAPRQIGNGWSSMNLLVGGVDMTGDGVPDLVARDSAGGLHLYAGNGKAGFFAPVRIGNGWSGMTSIFSPGNFVGTASADILAHGANGTLYAYEGRGMAYLVGAGAVGNGWQSLVTKASAGPAATKPRALGAGFGDVDGVPGNDIVALGAGGDVLIYGGDGAGGFGAVTTARTGWSAEDTAFALGDFTGDRRTDLGRIDGAGVLWLYPATGSGFGDPIRLGQGWGSFTRVVGGIDFDGDGNSDVIALTTDGRMLLYAGDGSGGWKRAGVQIGQGWGNAQLLVHVGDFDGDGAPDLMARFADGSLRIYPTTGSGSFRNSQQIGQGWNGMVQIVGPGDFDGDGNPDLIGVTTAGTMHLYSGNGTGGWSAARQIGWGWQTLKQIA